MGCIISRVGRGAGDLIEVEVEVEVEIDDVVGRSRGRRFRSKGSENVGVQISELVVVFHWIGLVRVWDTEREREREKEIVICVCVCFRC